MRIVLLFSIFLFSIVFTSSCTDKKMPSKSNREAVEQDMIGIWELLKHSYSPGRQPSLIDPRYREYLEIKSDGTCQDGQNTAKWFLSYTNDFVFDSVSKVLFTEVSNLDSNSWGNYDRNVKPFQIKLTTENNVKYLQLTSLKSSDTRIYIRKN